MRDSLPLPPPPELPRSPDSPADVHRRRLLEVVCANLQQPRLWQRYTGADRETLIPVVLSVAALRPNYFDHLLGAEIELVAASLYRLFRDTLSASTPFEARAFQVFFERSVETPVVALLPRIFHRFNLLGMVAPSVVPAAMDDRMLRTRFSEEVLAELVRFHGTAAREELLRGIAESIQVELRAEALARGQALPATTARGAYLFADLLAAAEEVLLGAVPPKVNPQFWCVVNEAHLPALGLEWKGGIYTLHRLRAAPRSFAVYPDPFFPAEELLLGWCDPVQNVASIDWTIRRPLGLQSTHFTTAGVFTAHADRLVHYTLPT